MPLAPQKAGRRLPAAWRLLLALGSAAGLVAIVRRLLRLASHAQKRGLGWLRLPKVQHVVLLKMPGVREDSDVRAAFGKVCEDIKALPGVGGASFHAFGSLTLDKRGLLAELGKPDISLGFTHCLLMVTDDLAALKDYLHGPVQTEQLRPLIGSSLGGDHPVVAVTDLEVGFDFVHEGKADPILEIVLLRFQVHVTPASKVYESFQQAVQNFSKSRPGIQASLRLLGHGDLTKDELIQEIDWQDRANDTTHVLTVAADSVVDLKELMASDEYAAWIQTESPHLVNDGKPSAVVFFVPLQFTTTMY